jgi:hypothetical protein
MSWTDVADILFQAGVLLAAGGVAYGAWLSITAPQADPHKAAGGGRARDATPGAKPVPPPPADAARRERIRARRKGAMKAWAGSGVLVLLLLASAGYVIFGGAYEVGSAPEAETSNATVAAELADVGGTLRKENLSARSETEEQ